MLVMLLKRKKHANPAGNGSFCGKSLQNLRKTYYFAQKALIKTCSSANNANDANNANRANYAGNNLTMPLIRCTIASKHMLYEQHAALAINHSAV